MNRERREGVCAWCHESYTYLKGGGRERKYCSPQCKAKGTHERRTKAVRICQGPRCCIILATPRGHRGPGRSRDYCSKSCARAAAAQRTAQRRAQREGEIFAALPPTPSLIPKPLVWWVAQAMGIMERCIKCEGPVEGTYVSATPETMGECAVVAHCRLCGRERVVITGRGGVPYSLDELEAARAHRTPSKTTLWRRAHPGPTKAYRPARVAGGQGKTRAKRQERDEHD